MVKFYNELYLYYYGMTTLAENEEIAKKLNEDKFYKFVWESICVKLNDQDIKNSRMSSSLIEEILSSELVCH